MPYSDIKLISFDLDNTLYDNWPIIQIAETKSQQFLKSAFNKQKRVYDHQVFINYRTELLSEENLLQHSDKTLFEDMSLLRHKVLSKCCELLDEPSKITDQALNIFLNYRNKITIDSKVTAMLQQLSNHYILVSVTNGNCDASQLSISNLLTKNYSPSLGYRAKPHPEMLEQVLEDFSLSPHQVLHIGDEKATDGEVAKQVNCKFLHFEPFIKGQSLSKHCKRLTDTLCR